MHSLLSISLLFLIVGVSARLQKYDDEENTDQCTRLKCEGKEYKCIDGLCYCADGYIPNHFQNKCVKCPDHKEKCFGYCCSKNTNVTLTCWHGICQFCYDENDNWTCRESLDNILLISSTQIAMASALVLGIIATFVLLYKLCAVSTLRPLGTNYESRLSIGSLQVYVEERLRDAPPRYSRAPPSDSILLPATVYVNAGFVHESSIPPPPPPYTPHKDEENPNNSVHI